MQFLIMMQGKESAIKKIQEKNNKKYVILSKILKRMIKINILRGIRRLKTINVV
jgi:hypothetical protein